MVPKTVDLWPLLSRLVLVCLLGLVIIPACPSPSRPPMTLSDDYQEMFDINLFHERVKLLNSVSYGATQEEVLTALGEPRSREVNPDGLMVFIYRVRCYTGPEPFSRWPRHQSLTYENHITFDRQGRVKSTRSIP